MTTIAFPALTNEVAPGSMTWGQRSNSRVHLSPLSGSVQTVELPGARWALSARFPVLRGTDLGLMQAFMAQLRGQANRFTVHDWSAPQPRGTMRGTLTTSGTTAQGATSITITGGAGQAGTTWLAGDKFAVGGEVKIVAANATANGSGVVTVTFEPPLRAAVSSGAAVTWDRPAATFMLAQTSWQVEYDNARPRIGSLSFDAVEVW